MRDEKKTSAVWSGKESKVVVACGGGVWWWCVVVLLVCSDSKLIACVDGMTMYGDYVYHCQECTEYP